jgi:hypothetical protein
MLAIWIVVLAMLPFWWTTTTVYRADIPFARIRALNEVGLAICVCSSRRADLRDVTP